MSVLQITHCYKWEWMQVIGLLAWLPCRTTAKQQQQQQQQHSIFFTLQINTQNHPLIIVFDEGEQILISSGQNILRFYRGKTAIWPPLLCVFSGTYLSWETDTNYWPCFGNKNRKQFLKGIACCKKIAIGTNLKMSASRLQVCPYCNPFPSSVSSFLSFVK